MFAAASEVRNSTASAMSAVVCSRSRGVWDALTCTSALANAQKPFARVLPLIVWAIRDHCFGNFLPTVCVDYARAYRIDIDVMAKQSPRVPHSRRVRGFQRGRGLEYPQVGSEVRAASLCCSPAVGLI